MVAGGLLKSVAGVFLLVLGALLAGSSGGGPVLPGLDGRLGTSCLRLGAVGLGAAVLDLTAALLIHRRASPGRVFGLASGVVGILLGVAGAAAVTRFVGGSPRTVIDVVFVVLCFLVVAAPVTAVNAAILRGLPQRG